MFGKGGAPYSVTIDGLGHMSPSVIGAEWASTFNPGNGADLCPTRNELAEARRLIR
jgi:hypothetical protein